MRTYLLLVLATFSLQVSAETTTAVNENSSYCNSTDPPTVRSLEDENVPHCWFWKNESGPNPSKVFVNIENLLDGCPSVTKLEGPGTTENSSVRISKAYNAVAISIPEVGLVAGVFRNSNATINIDLPEGRHVFVQCKYR